MSSRERTQVLIVGAGIGGLTAAIYAAISGLGVLVLEKNSHVGGKMGEFRANGYRWDTGPSVITMKQVLDQVFSAAGRNLTDYLSLLPIEPLTRYFFPDGTVLDASADLRKMLPQIRNLHEPDVEGCLAYLAYVARIHRITGPVFIYDPPPTPASFLKVPPGEYLKIDPFRTMQQAISNYVHSPHLRQMLGRYATYVGADPYQAPATLNVIGHVELNQGVYYPRGGVYQIAAALERLATELGVRILTDMPVTKVVIKDQQAVGVVTQPGEIVDSEHVIANIDVGTVYEQLLSAEPNLAGRRKRLLQADLSCSGFIMLLGVQAQHLQLAHHNIFFSPDYRQEFNQIFRQQIPADRPTIYLAITSRTDPSHAPAGCENWFVLVNSPPANSQTDWNQYKHEYRQKILEQLTVYGLNVDRKITFEKIYTPLDIESQTGARRGALYGLTSNTRLAAFRRPHNRDPHIRNLYFCGGTTHPGGGVPMVMLSGRNAAALVIAHATRSS
jgi:phytoene desaturase